MEFMNEYKRLDNLCKDVFRSDAGVSRYIEAMNSYGNNVYSVNGWTSDKTIHMQQVQADRIRILEIQ